MAKTAAPTVQEREIPELVLGESETPSEGDDSMKEGDSMKEVICNFRVLMSGSRVPTSKTDTIFDILKQQNISAKPGGDDSSTLGSDSFLIVELDNSL